MSLPLTPEARSMLLKLLALSESSNDAEALSAIRHAHRLLDRCGKRWVDVVPPAAPMFHSFYEARDQRPPDADDAGNANSNRY